MSSPTLNIIRTIRLENKCYISNDDIAHCQGYYESTSNNNKKEDKINPIIIELNKEAEKLKLPPLKNGYLNKNLKFINNNFEKKKNKILLKNKSSPNVLQQQKKQKKAELTPNVTKLMRGELLQSNKPKNTNKIIRKKVEDIRKLEDYKEQIQICVANPGRFSASWTLLVILFGEDQLNNYINKNAWNKKELKDFVINED